MDTLNSLLHQLTDTQILMEKMQKALRNVDPEFTALFADFQTAAEKLEAQIGDSVTPCASEYLAACEKRIASDLLYAGWLGFQLNLLCFYDPQRTDHLDDDFASIHQEHRMCTLPAHMEAEAVIGAFIKALPEDKLALTDNITEYYCYLQTVGYKLAHYFGYTLANHFLYHVVPGYIHDQAATSRYTQRIKECLAAGQ